MFIYNFLAYLQKYKLNILSQENNQVGLFIYHAELAGQ